MDRIVKIRMSYMLTIKRFGLMTACWLLVFCFLLGNDTYNVKAFVKKNKNILGDAHRVINFQDAIREQQARKSSEGLLSNLKYEASKNPLNKAIAMAVGGDTCGAAPAMITSPYADSDTTVGAADDYDLPPDVATPTATACPTCTATGGGPAGAAPRGGIYTGTGTGPDKAYKVTFNSGSTNTLTVSVDPTSTQDLSMIVYQTTCSNLLSDAIAVDDDGVGGATETVTITNMPAGTYYAVVDGYSSGGTPPGPSGPYNFTATFTGPTAADASINGRAVSSFGRGIANISVAITDLSGNTRYARTNQLGYFRFTEVESGQTYIINASSKRYQFNSQTITVNENIENLVITAQ